MSLQKEKKDRRIGLLISMGVHAAVILLFFFILAWKQPYPPKPEYGIELNFGLEEAGYGEEQPQTVSNTPQDVQEEVQPEEKLEEEQIQEEVFEEEPAPEEPSEPLPEEVQEEQPEEDIQNSMQEDSPVEATPEIKENKEPVKKTEPVKEKIVEDKLEESAKLPEKTVEEPAQKPEAEKVNDQAIYPVKKGGNQGETKDETGDAGKPEGTIEARALYGSQGGGEGGPRLDLPGWKWDFTPKPEDNSSEGGKIVFEIEVDDQGEVIGVKTDESTVSQDILQIYLREVRRLTFSSTDPNTIPPPVSEGKITFIIRAK